MVAPQPTTRIDARGQLVSTHMLFEVVTALEGIELGETLELITDDFPALNADIRSWSQITGHELLSTGSTGDEVYYVIRKGECAPTVSRMALVVSNDGLEELLSPLGFALAAALEGLHVSVYLQGPAVRALVPGFKPKLRGFRRMFSPFARRDLERAGHDHPLQKLRQIIQCGGDIYACGPSIRHFRVDTSTLALGEVKVVEYATFVPVMNEADIQIYS